MLFFEIVLVAVLVARLERGRSDRVPRAVERALGSRLTPLAVGLAWSAAVWWSWGSLAPTPVVHDEIAYRLQSHLFAEGRWTAPSPPLADFFAQPHVLVAPVIASKYPPGHSLLLALGELVGAPVLVVIFLAGLRGAMTFALARRLSNGTVALATSLFLLHGDSLLWAASWFSETTTAALLLVAWYALLRWRSPDASGHWLLLVAATLGWCAITRPLSAVAFGLPIAVVVLREVLRRRRWRELGMAMTVGTMIVAIIPLWSWRTTGDPRLWPVTQYTRDYMPYDHPHFGVDLALPRRELPVDLASIAPSLEAEERNHTLARLPATAAERATFLADASWTEPHTAGVLALIGLATAPAAVWLGAGTVLALFVSYLAHPTWANWTIYYVEIAPVLVFLMVFGLAALLRWLAHAGRTPDRGRRHVPAVTSGLLLAMLLGMVFVVSREIARSRALHQANPRYQDRFHEALRRIKGPAVLFVRHAAWHSPHYSLITNGPDWERAPVWVVPDRGTARNAALLHAAPGRKAFLFVEAQSRIDGYDPEVSPP